MLTLVARVLEIDCAADAASGGNAREMFHGAAPLMRIRPHTRTADISNCIMYIYPIILHAIIVTMMRRLYSRQTWKIGLVMADK